MDKKKMLGTWDYTVILTYLSAISALLGIVITLSGTGHPYCGCFFLVASGIFDAFDGKVARTKKDRTEQDCKFGIQIDSLTDLVAFGALPACIGIALLKVSPISFLKWTIQSESANKVMFYAFTVIFVLYFIAALCRLAYFNITEEERQKETKENRQYFEGLPVTTSAILIPLLMLIQFLTGKSLLFIYVALIAFMGFMFVYNKKIKKCQTKEIVIMSIVAIITVVFFVVRHCLAS